MKLRFKSQFLTRKTLLLDAEATVAGTKRKAEDDMKFNENGNWTLETAKNRLGKLYQAKGLDVNVPLQCIEVGFPPNKAR